MIKCVPHFLPSLHLLVFLYQQVRLYAVKIVLTSYFYFSQLQVFDGALLSLALTYTMSLANQAFGYILWSTGEVEGHVSIP